MDRVGRVLGVFSLILLCYRGGDWGFMWRDFFSDIEGNGVDWIVSWFFVSRFGAVSGNFRVLGIKRVLEREGWGKGF